MSHCKVSCCKALEANPETFSSRLPRNSSLRARNMFFCISCWNLKSTADVYNVTHIYIHYIIYNTYKYVYIYTVYIYIHIIYARRYLCQHMWNATALDGTCASMLRVKASVLQTPCPQHYEIFCHSANLIS